MTSLRYPLEIGRNGSFAVDREERDKARSRIMATIITSVGERVMRPDFGTDMIQAYYLSGEVVLTAVEDSITDLFSRMTAAGYWKDIRLQFVEARFDPRYDNSTVSVDVQWRQGDTVVTASDTLNIQNLIRESAT